MKTIIVAGITRSGLTLMMQILNKGGYPCYGEYPSFEVMSGIDYQRAQGMAIKSVDTHRNMPPEGSYYVIRLNRNKKQQAKSICKFFSVLSNIPIKRSEARIIQKSLAPDYRIIDNWAKRQDRFITVEFEELIKNPQAVVDRIKEEFRIKLSDDAIDCVVARGTDCYEGLLEATFIID